MKYKLSEIMDILGGGTPKTNRPDYWNGGIPWLSVKDFNNDYRYVYKTEKTITEAGLNSSATQLLRRNDIIISARGTVGAIAMIPFPMAFNQSCYGLRGRPKLVDQEFLYYLVKYNIHALQKNTHGSVFDTITRDTFAGIEVNLPSLAKQEAIAGILKSLDDKIEFNNQINENLADQIQAIYSKEYDPSTHTPSGVLADICHYSSDRVPVSKLSVSTYYSTENMQPNKKGSVDATSLPSIALSTGCHKGDVLISNIRPYFKKIVYVTDDSCGCSNDVLCFVPKEDHFSAFLFGTLYMDRFFDYMVAGSKGTKMPRGDKQQIMNYPVVLPDRESLDLFNGLIIPMLDQIAANRIESNRLAALRDALMPKLMSGELNISELDL